MVRQRLDEGTSARRGEAVNEDSQEQAAGDVGLLRRAQDTAESDAGQSQSHLALEAPWRNPEAWWLRGGGPPVPVAR